MRFATLFLYSLPPEQVQRFQKDTPIITGGGRLITADSFRKNYLKTATFHFYNKGGKK